MHGTQRPQLGKKLIWLPPQPLARELPRGGKGCRICGPDRHFKIVPAGIKLDERSIFFIWTAIVPHLSGGSVRFIRSPY
jgi:hypothetical protein